MARFSLNDKVIHVGSNSRGIITQVHPPRGTRQVYSVTWIGTGNEEMCLESNLAPEVRISNAFDLAINGIFGSFSDYSRINTALKIQNTSINSISSLKASKTLFKAYQYKPLLKFLNSDNRRILVADEVGLGKTIEAGHVLMEMKARHELRHSLIVCPKSLAEKWRFELQDKFEIQYKIYQHKAELIEDLKSNRRIMGIINYEKLRRTAKNDIITSVIEKGLQFDIVICDEAHKLRNSGTETYNAVQELLYNTKSTLFLTATPIMLGESNLYNLMHLLDPDRFDNIHVFADLISANKPFIRALSELNAGVPFADIARNLSESIISYGEVYEVEDEDEEDGGGVESFNQVHASIEVKVADEYKDVPLYNKIINELSILPETNESRVMIQNDISSISVLNNIFSRTRKKEVTTDWSQAVRHPQTVVVDLSMDEIALHDRIIASYEEEYIREHNGSSLGMELPLSTIRRRLASSIWGQFSDWEKEGFKDDDAKYTALLQIIQQKVSVEKKKIIVFATFKRTLSYLYEKLKTIGLRSAIISYEVEDRSAVCKQFQYDSNLNILLSSEVGSEGLDMQFCDTIVNYDLPWNPMVVEQRIGRVDRFGQKSPAVDIYTIMVRGTVQEKIYNRLLERIGVFKECIGDIEVILDRFCEKYGMPQDFLSNLEIDLESKSLTEAEKNEKIDNICKAILNVKKDIEEISEGLTDTLTNDMYFKEEISRITETGRYITEEEIKNFIANLIARELPTCSLEKLDDNAYIFRIPQSSPQLLKNFMVRIQAPEASSTYKRFVTEVASRGSFRLTFDQQYAFEHKDLEYINVYHPLVVAAFDYFNTLEEDVNNSFNFMLSRQSSPKLASIPSGNYLMATYLVNIEKHIFNTVQTNSFMVPLIYSLERQSFLDDRGVCELIFGLSQRDGQKYLGNDKESIAPDIYLDFTEEIDSIQQQYIDNITIKLDSNKVLQKQRTSTFYDKKINSLMGRIESYRTSMNNSELRLIPALEGQLQSVIDEKRYKLDAIESYSIAKIPEKLISVSLVHLI